MPARVHQTKMQMEGTDKAKYPTPKEMDGMPKSAGSCRCKGMAKGSKCAACSGVTKTSATRG